MTEKDQQTSSFGADRAITRTSEDKFGRAYFAKRVAVTIGDRLDPSSLIVGLYAPWGDGKTSVLNFIREELAAYPLVTCVTFNPWRFDNEAALLEGFFTTLAAELEAKLTTRAEDIGKLLKQYSGLLKLGHPGLSDVASTAGHRLSSVSLEVMRDRISGQLSANHIRVVVLIDDIDRMEKSEIQAIFRLVKLTADFENTAYILAFDERMVASAIGERYSSAGSNPSDAGRSFLEKIVQVPLHLPRPKKEKLRSYCFELLYAAVADAKLNFSQDEVNRFVAAFTQGLQWRMTTPRMAVRYINAIRFAMGILQDEVCLSDLLLLEGIRTFLPSLYELIRSNADLFLAGPQERASFKEKDSLDVLLGKLDIAATDPEQQAIRSLLDGLFPRTGRATYGSDWEGRWSQEKRITSSNYFERYFTYTIDETDIPDRRIRTLIESLGDISKPASKLLDLVTKDNARTVIVKLRIMEGALDAQVSRKLILQIVDTADLFPNPNSLARYAEPFAQAAILVSNLFKNVDATERFAFADTLIAETSHLYFLGECVRWLSSKSDALSGDRIFKEEEEADLRRNLAGKIRTNFQRDLANFRFDEEGSQNLLDMWQWGTSPDEVKAFASTVLTEQPVKLFGLLRSGRGTAWSGVSGLPTIPDFSRHAYDCATRIADAGLLRALAQAFISANDEVIHSSKENDRDSNSYLAKRFLEIDEHVRQSVSTPEHTGAVSDDSGPNDDIGPNGESREETR